MGCLRGSAGLENDGYSSSGTPSPRAMESRTVAARFGDHLEALVPNLEVYNFGPPTEGPDQHYLLFRHCVRDIEHNLIVIAVCVENVRRVVTRYRYFKDEAGCAVLYEKPYSSLSAVVLYCVVHHQRTCQSIHGLIAQRGGVAKCIGSDAFPGS